MPGNSLTKRVALLQVLLMLSSDLEDNERDRAALDKVLSTCLEELKLDQMVTMLDKVMYKSQ